jgi:hypothetical protein
MTDATGSKYHKPQTEFWYLVSNHFNFEFLINRNKVISKWCLFIAFMSH